ncbi:hypothetical protein EJ131_15745 [Bacillus mycoides]|nr:hypothetical protein [Bacillus mycoides]
MFCSVCNFLSIFRHLTLVSYKNYYNTLFSLKQSALFIPLFAGSKTPTSKFSLGKEVRWEINCP